MSPAAGPGTPAVASAQAESLSAFGAVQAAEAVRAGEVTSEDLVRACLEHIAEVEDTVQAWAHLDPDHALEQARRADEWRKEGRPLGPLHGVPVGVKDIFDTHDLPTEDGTVLHAGRRPVQDSTVVARLREAGAVVMGKTVTTELALYTPGKTRNPLDPARTPGGSSSGSAAAVAARMVPLAVGSQTNGSVIRPAAYCGIVGFKPTHGLISRHRVLPQSRWLDHVGVMARHLEDAAVLVEALAGHDPSDPDTRPQARPRLLETLRQIPPVTPQFVFVRTPMWDQAEAATQEAFAELVAFLGAQVETVDLPDQFANVAAWHQRVMEADIARSFAPEYQNGRERLSPHLIELIERGRRVLAIDYNEALAKVPEANRALEALFRGCDAILTPATTGEAPVGLESTGSPIFCTIWTFCGTPALTLPLLQGPSGMPLGVQLVGARGDDARLLRTARWLAEAVGQGAVEET